jgi:hypothetical protein
VLDEHLSPIARRPSEAVSASFRSRWEEADVSVSALWCVNHGSGFRFDLPCMDRERRTKVAREEGRERADMDHDLVVSGPLKEAAGHYSNEPSPFMYSVYYPGRATLCLPMPNLMKMSVLASSCLCQPLADHVQLTTSNGDIKYGTPRPLTWIRVSLLVRHLAIELPCLRRRFT